MTIVEKTPTTLVIQSRPWLEWLVGVAFIAGGAWAFVSGERVFGGAFVVAGLVIIVAFANMATIRFDRGTGRFTRTIKGLVRNTVIDHPLDAISGVRVEASASGNSSRSYRVAVVMRPGTRVPLTFGYTSGRQGKEQLAAEIRRFLNIAEVPEDPPGFGEMLGAIVDTATRSTRRDE